MTATHQPASATSADPLATAIGFGLLLGITELLLVGVKVFVLHRVVRLSSDIVWMAPLADICIMLVAGLALRLLAMRWPAARSIRVVVSALAFIAVYALLLHYRPLHHVARLLLAAGIATQAGVIAARRPVPLSRLLRLTAGWAWPPAGTTAPAGDWPGNRRAFVATAATVVAGAAVGNVVRQRRAVSRALAALPPPPAEGYNVVLIVLDTVRARSMSLHGYERPTTPALERLARESTVFDMALATAPWTLPTHASMFTGRNATELSADWDVPLDSRWPTLAEALGRAGWSSAGFVANTFYASREHGLHRGFNRWEDYRRSPGQIIASSSLGSAIACGNRNEVGCRWRGAVGWYELLGRKHARHVSASFLAWLDRRPARPFFAYLNYFDAHAPYLPGEEAAAAFGPPGRRTNPMHLELPGWEWTPERVALERGAYEAAIARLDTAIGALVDELDRRGLRDNTLLIITSDHGEEFMEHGVMTHGNSLYLPALHVPLMMRLPGRIPAGLRVPEPVSLRDVPSTIGALLGVPALADFPGTSLARHWGGPAANQPVNLIARTGGRSFRPPSYPVQSGDLHGVLTERYHYIRRGDGREELYDVLADPGETRDVAGQADLASELQRLRAILDSAIEEGRPYR